MKTVNIILTVFVQLLKQDELEDRYLIEKASIWFKTVIEIENYYSSTMKESHSNDY